MILLIVVMSVVNGMNLYIADHIANLGTNTFVVHQFQWAQGFEEFLKAKRRNQPIRIEDYEFLRDTHGLPRELVTALLEHRSPAD